mmetsp:Transcript_21646/g.67543  ORF Transcript_21646/g.67543 Transcript_21646/m.67543 type:complete len:216 (+) Transcript_21646:288-935(+)
MASGAAAPHPGPGSSSRSSSDDSSLESPTPPSPSPARSPSPAAFPSTSTLGAPAGAPDVSLASPWAASIADCAPPLAAPSPPDLRAVDFWLPILLRLRSALRSALSLFITTRHSAWSSSTDLAASRSRACTASHPPRRSRATAQSSSLEASVARSWAWLARSSAHSASSSSASGSSKASRRPTRNSSARSSRSSVAECSSATASPVTAMTLKGVG